MKSYANLWPRITSFENLYEAFRAALRGKRARVDGAALEFELEGPQGPAGRLWPTAGPCQPDAPMRMRQ